MKNFFLFIVILTACASATQPHPALPAQVWLYAGSKSFAPQNPGLGISHRYTSAAGWIDIYIYDLQHSDWQHGIADPQFAEYFESTVTEVRYVAKQGNYVDLQVSAIRDISISGQLFRTINFQYSKNGKPIRSATYINRVTTS